MFRLQINRLFRHYYYLFVIIFIASVISKAFALAAVSKNSILTKEEYELLDGYISESYDMAAGEKLKYYEECSKEASSSSGSHSTFTPEQNALQEYRESLINIYTVNGIKRYVRKGEGLVSVFLPPDFFVNKEIYASLDLPDVVNRQHFRKFISLQSYSLMPVFIMLLAGIITADSAEKRISLMAGISKNSKKFFMSQEIVLSIVILVMLLINTFADLLLSGLLTHSYELSASLQSVSDYFFVPVNASLFQIITLITILELFGAFICFHAFSIAAAAFCSVKKYMIFSVSLILVTSLISSLFPDTSPYMLTAVSDKGNIIQSIAFIKSLDSTNIFIFLTAALMQTAALCAWRFTGYREIH